MSLVSIWRMPVLRFLKVAAIQGVREVFEVKMLIVGKGGTGKTTLWNLLQNPDHPVPDPAQKSTTEISIKILFCFRNTGGSISKPRTSGSAHRGFSPSVEYTLLWNDRSKRLFPIPRYCRSRL